MQQHRGELQSEVAPAARLVVRIPGPPVAQGRTGHSRTGFRYDPKKSRVWKHMAAVLMREAMGRPGPMFPAGPVEVVIVGVRACPEKAKRKRSVTPRRFDASHVGDADNVAKAVLDGATQAGVWKDDCQVARLVVERWIGASDEAPSVLISIAALEPAGGSSCPAE